jgi:hypothetical protein
MTEETWPGEAHFRAQLDVQRKFPGWTVSHYPNSGAMRRGTQIPAGHYCAVHWRLSEAPIVAPDLDSLTVAIKARNAELEAARLWAERSALSAFLPRRYRR